MVPKKILMKSIVSLIISLVIGVLVAYFVHKLFVPPFEEIFQNHKDTVLFGFCKVIINVFLPLLVFICSAGLLNGTIHNSWINKDKRD